MSAGKTIMVIPTILVLALFVYLTLSIRSSTTSVIGAVIVEPGFNNLQPQINGRNYHSNGDFTANIRSYSRTPITITEIRIFEKATNRECDTTLISEAGTMLYKETANITAKCPRRSIDDVYLLSTEINYRLGDSKQLHQETGDLTGDIKP